MPSTSRGANAATLCAVVLAIALALIWLRSSDDATPHVPGGLSVATLPAQASPDEAVAPARDIERERAGGGRAVRKSRKGERAGRRERAGGVAKRDHAERARDGHAGQDPPATAPAPSAGSGTGTGGPGPSQPVAPEFALE